MGWLESLRRDWSDSRNNHWKNNLAIDCFPRFPSATLGWHYNGRDSVSNHQPHDCLLNRLSRRRSKKTSKLRITGLSAGNSPGTGEFPAQRVSNAEDVFIWWRHRVWKMTYLRRGLVWDGESSVSIIWCHISAFNVALVPPVVKVHLLQEYIIHWSFHITFVFIVGWYRADTWADDGHASRRICASSDLDAWITPNKAQRDHFR